MFGLQDMKLSVRLGQQETKTTDQFMSQQTVRALLANGPAAHHLGWEGALLTLKEDAAECGSRTLSGQTQKQKLTLKSYRIAWCYDFRACMMERN